MAAVTSDAPIVCPGHTRPISELSFSGKTSDGVFFISGCVDQNPMLRDGTTGDWIGTFEGHTGAVWSAKMNATATRCVTAGADFRIKVWNAIEGAQIAEFEDKSVVKTVDFTLDEKSIVAGGYSKRILVFPVASRSSEPTLAIDHPTRIRKLAVLPSGLVVTGDDKGVLRTWSLEGGGKMLHELEPSGVTKPETHDIVVVREVAGGPLADSGGGIVVCCGRWVLFLSVDEEGVLTVKHRAKVPFLARVDSADVHPNGTTVILGGGDAASAATTRGGVASLYVFLVELLGWAGSSSVSAAPSLPTAADAATTKPSSSAATSSRPSYASAAASSGTGDKPSRRDPSGCRIVSISKGHVGPIRCLRFAPEGEKFSSGGEDGNIRLWSTASQRTAGVAGMEGLPAVNDEGKALDSGAGDKGKSAGKTTGGGVYRPGAFGGSARRRM